MEVANLTFAQENSFYTSSAEGSRHARGLLVTDMVGVYGRRWLAQLLVYRSFRWPAFRVLAMSSFATTARSTRCVQG